MLGCLIAANTDNSLVTSILLFERLQMGAGLGEMDGMEDSIQRRSFVQ